jgi:hypothetical protein
MKLYTYLPQLTISRYPGHFQAPTNGTNLDVTLNTRVSLAGSLTSILLGVYRNNDHTHANISFGILLIDFRASMLLARNGRSAYIARYGSEGLSSKSRTVGLGIRGQG